MIKDNNFSSTIAEIIKYGGSTFAALIASSIYVMTDEVFIGHSMGLEGLSAMGLAYPVTVIATALSTLAEVGSSAIVSESIGKGNINRAESLMRGNYIYLTVIGVLIAAICIFFVEPILHIIPDSDSDAKIFGYAASYLHIYFCGMPFLLIVTLTQTFMRCIDRPNHVFYILAATAAANIILDVIFIFGLSLGIQGAAAATVLAQVIGSLMSFWYFTRSKQKFKTSWSICEFTILFQECQIGLGFAILELAIFPIGFFVNYILIKYNASHLLAAASIVNVVMSFIYLPLTGLDTGVQPLVTRLYASNNLSHLMRVIKYSCFITMSMTIFMYLVIMLFAEEISQIFVSEGVTLSEDMITFVRYGFLLYPCVGVFTWISGIMAALEDTWRNIFLYVMAPILQLTLIYMIPKFLPIEMLSLHYSIMDLIGAICLMAVAIPFLHSKGLYLRKIFSL